MTTATSGIPLAHQPLMDTHVLHHYPSADSVRWIAVAFITGAISVLAFHQGALALLYAAHVAGHAPYSLVSTAPFGIPQLWSLAFWGGVWGVVLAELLRRLDGARLIGLAVLFGAIFPTLVAWFVVAPLKGQPIAAGGAPKGMAVALIVNAAWGLGAGLGLYLFGRRR